MTNDHQHPGENNPPHKPRPSDEPPHDQWEGPLEGEELNEIDPGKIREQLDKKDERNR